jgi:hypothetical protein
MRTHCFLRHGALALIAALAACAASAGPADALPLPRDARTEIIGDDMRFNGASMQIVRFDTADAQATEGFYRDFFVRHGRAGKSVVNERNGARVLSGIQDGRLITAEFAGAAGATSVLVSSMVLAEMRNPEELAPQAPRMPGTAVLQVIESRDGPVRNTVTSMRNNQTVEGNATYLRAQMLRAGWSRQRDHTEQTQVARQLLFTRDGKESLVDIRRMDNGETYIVMNETQR